MLNFDLLDSLDAQLRAQGVQRIPDGEVCVGIRKKDGDRWWHARFAGGGVQTQFVAAVPGTVNAVLLLGEKEASSMLWFGTIPENAELIEFDGDRGYMEQFIQRHLTPAPPS
jgi:hypothetical protein